ncbi:MAG TPA: hypothetical protein VFG46_23445 [Chryseolinea sp.]|nr:hypothetical protein [Chryseolinea sp.]
MKTKINIVVMIVVASMFLFACVEEEIGPKPTPQPTTGISNTNVPIK